MDILIADARLAIADLDVAESRTLNRPTLLLDGVLRRVDRRSFALSSSDVDLRGSVVFTIPLTSGGENRIIRLKAINFQSAAVLDKRETSRNVRLEAVMRWGEVSAAAVSEELALIGVQSATLALKGTTREAEIGERTQLEVLNAEQRLLRTSLQLIDAKRNLALANLRIILLMGLLPEY